MTQDRLNHRGNRFSFEELLTHCGDVSSCYWQIAWAEFENRYDRFIYKKIAERCAAMRPPRLCLQFSATVEDILSEMKVTLLKHDCRALRNFRGKHSETIFLAWLKQIAHRTTRAYLQRNYKEYFSETETMSLDFVHCADQQNEGQARREAFQEIVASLRSLAACNARNTERDINIFLLYTLSEFNADMFMSHPLFKRIGHRVVDNVVNRTRDRLAQSSDLRN